MKLLRKTKKEFYNNLDISPIHFGKPSFKDKALIDERITLNEKIAVFDERELVEIFNEYFSSIIQNLDNDTVTVRKTVKKCQNHTSIKVIPKT